MPSDELVPPDQPSQPRERQVDPSELHLRDPGRDLDDELSTLAAPARIRTDADRLDTDIPAGAGLSESRLDRLRPTRIDVYRPILA